MATKEKALSTEDRFYLNLDEDITHEVEYHKFVFVLKIPDLLLEAGTSLGGLRMAQELLKFEEYAPLMASIKLPKLGVPEEDEVQPDIDEQSVDLNKLQHVRYALSFLPDEFVDTVNNIAYLNVVIADIRYGDKPLWIRNETTNEEIRINTFYKFVKHVHSKRIRWGLLVETLLTEYQNWINELDIEPQEVKN